MTKLAIFDLDGTLLNTVEDLGNATNYALTQCWFSATRTAVSLSLALNVFTSRSSTWRPATAARTSASRRRRTAA